jgi:hypothetical protein
VNEQPSYASIALIDFGANDHVSIVAVSVLEEECVLSGAWSYCDSDSSEIVQLLNERLLIVLGDQTRAKNILRNTHSSEVALSEFLMEAGREARNALDTFNSFVEQNIRDYVAYMAILPAERKLLPKMVKKKLTQPHFYNWPKEIDLEKAREHLDSIGKLSKIQGTPSEMEIVIAASRLVKLLVDMWRNDEQERNNRVYVDRKEMGLSLLPKVWLKELTSMVRG